MSDGDAAPPTVLVADDDDDIREIISEELRRDGWRVIEASSGDMALARAIAESPSVLVIDQRMPGMTGAEVVAALLAEGRRIPTIIISAASDVREIAGRVGAAAYLGKPFGLDDLLPLLHRALQSAT